MPTNVTTEYYIAEKAYHKAKTTVDKIAALKRMLAVVPKHKGTEKLRNSLKQRLAKLKRELAIERKARGKSIAIKKEGAAQIVILGLPNVGKSHLLARLSGKPVKSALYPFTTKEPEIRMIPYEDIKFQGIEIPAIYKGFASNPRGRQLLSIVRNADFVLVLVSSSSDLRLIEKELEEVNIKLGQKKIFYEGFQILPYLVVHRKFDPEEIKKQIWAKLGKIRIYTYSKDKGRATKPLILNKGTTVKDVAEIVHKDFLKKFKYAKINGPSAKFSWQQVGLEHRLKDRDVIELFTR